MIVRPSVSSEIEFWDWVDTWPVGESVSLRWHDVERKNALHQDVINDTKPGVINILFDRRYAERDFPESAWSDIADYIYFSIKRMDYFDVYWRVGPEVAKFKDFATGDTKYGAYARLTVVPREKPETLPNVWDFNGCGPVPPIQSRIHEQDVAGTISDIYMWTHNAETGVVTEPQKVEWSHLNLPITYDVGIDSAVQPEEIKPIPTKEPCDTVKYVAAVRERVDSMMFASYPGFLKTKADVD